MVYFIDTNIFLRVLTADQKEQFIECKRLLEKIKENKISAFTSTVILTEVAWTLNSYYEFPKERVIQALKSILNLSGLKIIDSYDNLIALDLYQKYSVKYIDALIASSKELLAKNMTIITYDKDFTKLPVLYKTPKNLL